MGLLSALFGVSPRRSSRRKPSKAQQAERRRKAIARSEAKLKRERERAEKKRQAEQKRRERERAAAQRYRDAQQEKRLRGQDKIAKRLGLPTWRNPRGKRRNPTDAADLERARRMSREFHGSDDEVIELEDGERRLPKYVVALGSVPELSYEPSARYSKRAGWKWVHESGDRGDGKPRARQRPVLAADPATGRPVIVPMRSPVRMNFKRGLVG